MIATIYFNDEAHLRSKEVDDEPPEQRHLPVEPRAKLASTKRAPQLPFGRIGGLAMLMSVSGEDERASVQVFWLSVNVTVGVGS